MSRRVCCIPQYASDVQFLLSEAEGEGEAIVIEVDFFANAGRPVWLWAGGKAEEDKVGLIIRALNYTDIPIGVYYVEDQWMGAVMSYNGGGSQIGGTGFDVPREWRPGIKVRIDWQNDLMYAEDKEALRTDIVEIEPYAGKLNYLFVAFLPCNRIKVFASEGGPPHPAFPDKRYINPRDYCERDPACKEKMLDDTDYYMDKAAQARLLQEQKAWQAEACRAVAEGRSPL